MPIEVNEKGELIAPENTYDNLRSEEMSEIISWKHGFLEKWALFIFLTIISVLISSTWFIHYPDVIKTKATLIATNAPKEIFARQEGKLTRLFVQNGETVSEGDILGFIESTAKPEQVLLLSIYLDSTVFDLQKNNTQNIVTRFASIFTDLGELQQVYQQFVSEYQQFKDYLNDGFYLRKRSVLEVDALFLTKNHKILEQQKDLILKDLDLSEESYKANESLYKDKVISKQDDRNEYSKLLNKKLNIPQINASLLSNETQQREKQKEITELEHTISLQKNLFQQAAQTLQSLVNDWKKKYIIIAPVSGKLTFLTPLQENQFIKIGKSLGFVNPPNSLYYAEINLPQYNFGKIDTGQVVQLRFDAYPYQEFGFVKGQVRYISDLPMDSGFIAHIRLPDGLITNQKKTLHYREGLKAEAQIITKDLRLMERFYYNVVSSLNHR